MSGIFDNIIIKDIIIWQTIFFRKQQCSLASAVVMITVIIKQYWDWSRLHDYTAGSHRGNVEDCNHTISAR